jgi:hypothetical protein
MGFGFSEVIGFRLNQYSLLSFSFFIFDVVYF